MQKLELSEFDMTRFNSVNSKLYREMHEQFEGKIPKECALGSSNVQSALCPN